MNNQDSLPPILVGIIEKEYTLIDGYINQVLLKKFCNKAKFYFCNMELLKIIHN